MTFDELKFQHGDLETRREEENANRILREKLERAPEVFGLGPHEFEIMRRTPALNATHKARLVCIEEIK